MQNAISSCHLYGYIGRLSYFCTCFPNNNVQSIMIGTIVNTATIIAGGIIGALLHRGIKD